MKNIKMNNWAGGILMVLMMLSFYVKGQNSTYDSLIKYSQEQLYQDPLTAVPALEESLEIAIKAEDVNNISRSVLGLSIAYQMTEQYDEAFDLLTNYLDEYEKDATGLPLAKIYKAIGDLLYNTDAYEESLDYYNKAYALISTESEGPFRGKLLLSIGAVYLIFGDDSLALDNFRESLIITQKNDDGQAMIYVDNAIAGLHLEAGRKDSADFYYERALQYSKQLNSKHGKVISLIGLGKIALSKDNLLLAEGYLNEALQQQGIKTYDRIRILQQLASIATEKQDDQKAFAILKEANTLADSLQSVEMMSLSRKKLSEIEFKLGLTKSAYENLSKHLVLKDSIMNKELGVRVLSKEFLVMTQNRHELYQKERYLFFAIGISIVLVLLSVTLFAVTRIRRQKLVVKNQSLALELQKVKASELELDINQKNSVLSEKMLMLSATEKINNEILERVKNLRGLPADELSKQIQELVSFMNVNNTGNFWNEFQLYFTQTHPSFYDNLHKDFPNLTANERKLCAFIKLNMSIKDISSITMQSENAIKVARTRLRKKLDLSNKEISLIEFINQY